MKMKFLIDSDLLLETILNRHMLFNDYSSIWSWIESGLIEAYVTEVGMDKILSVARSMTCSEADRDEATELMMSVLKITDISPKKLQAARALLLKDFESAIEMVAAAEVDNCIAVITHRYEEFVALQGFTVPVWSPERLANVLFSDNQNVDAISSEASEGEISNLNVNFLTDLEQGLKWGENIRDFRNKLCQVEQKTINSNLPQNTCRYFLGREVELSDIWDIFHSNQQRQVVAICGAPGSGKTSLASEFARLCLESREKEKNICQPMYDTVIFVSSRHNVGSLSEQPVVQDELQTDYLGFLARQVALVLKDDSINRADPRDQWNRIYARLSKHQTLLILDGLDELQGELSQIDKFLKDIPNTVKVIITSRDNDLGYWRLDLKPLTPDESLRLLHNSLKKKGVVLRFDEISKLAMQCSGNPLAIKSSILLLSSYSRSIDWGKDQTPDIQRLPLFLAGHMSKLLSSQSSLTLLTALSLAQNSFEMSTLVRMAGFDEKDNAEVHRNLAELCRLSLVQVHESRYSLNPLVQDLVLRLLRQHSELNVELHERLLQWGLTFAEQYGGTDWGDCYVSYDLLEQEWENLQFILRWCQSHDRYQEIKQLWGHLNHFADLYGYWRDRIVWLDYLSRTAQRHGDQSEYVSALSRKIWSLIMLSERRSLAEAETILQEAWKLRDKATIGTQCALAHHRVTFYIRCKRYREALQSLLDIQKVLLQLKSSELDPRTIARYELNALRGQAKLNYEQGDFDEARRDYEEVLQRATAINWVRGVCYTRNKLADIALRQNDIERAEYHLCEGFPIAKRNRNKRRIAGYEKSFAHLEELRGDYRTARQWAERAIHHFSFIGMDHEIKKLTVAFNL
jgi:tetratricopeptide (TPR) repeat protein